MQTPVTWFDALGRIVQKPQRVDSRELAEHLAAAHLDLRVAELIVSKVLAEREG